MNGVRGIKLISKTLLRRVQSKVQLSIHTARKNWTMQRRRVKKLELLKRIFPATFETIALHPRANPAAK